ncbi:MAG: hypothetical protein QOJ32_2547 [Frankiaceae bacterium]|nr:hypothetical protein [Frankiaceae bacterium]
MTTTDLRPTPGSGDTVPHLGTTPNGPFVRIVLGALAVGALGAAALTLGVFPGANEHVTTGVALLAFAAGWFVLAALTSRMTSSPQRWAYVPAAFLAVAGLLLIGIAPGNDGMTAATWVWPPALLGVVVWSVLHARSSMPGRTRWLLYPVFGALALASLGALVENIALTRDAATEGMTGALYDVGGHRLHMTCTGTGGPTVVLESGLGGSSPLWAPIAGAVSGTTRVCAYDRAGTGWSDEASGPQDSQAVVTDLHRLLDVAGEHGPYVLAGHSVGGVYALTFAARYPDQVAGLVLLDSASPHQFTVLPAYEGVYAMLTRLYGVAPSLARLGLGQVIPALSANEVPGQAGKQAGAFATRPRDARGASDEVSTYRRSFTQAQALTSFGSKPLVVVSATDTLADTPGWAAAQQQLAALSRNADQRTVRSSHGGLLDHPASYPSSVAAITDVVRAARTGAAVGAP